MFFTPIPAPRPCPGVSTVTYEGKTYNTVQIGSQCWLKENLDVGVYVPSIKTGSTHSDVTNNGIIEKYCYNNDTANCRIYGGLYDWKEAMGYVTTAGARGICPAGWHIPTLAELQACSTAVGGNGRTLPAVGQGTGTNTSGYSALLAGYRNDVGNFYDVRISTYYWSSSEYSTNNARYIHLYGNDSYIYFYDYEKEFGFSVRCAKD
jgi:uncharacterized protein (TIGR02145 family)